jgi:hypothetical protein
MFTEKLSWKYVEESGSGSAADTAVSVSPSLKLILICPSSKQTRHAATELLSILTFFTGMNFSFPCCIQTSWGHHSKGYGRGLFPRMWSGRSFMLTTHFHLI